MVNDHAYRYLVLAALFTITGLQWHAHGAIHWSVGLVMAMWIGLGAGSLSVGVFAWWGTCGTDQS